MCVCQCVHGSIFTLGSLLEAPPQGASSLQASGLAADARGSAGAGVQRDGPDHQRQRQVQVETPRNVHINLPGRRGGKTDRQTQKLGWLGWLRMYSFCVCDYVPLA